MKNLSVIGSTGSIGRQAMELASEKDICIKAMACGSTIHLALEQINRFKPSYFAVMDKDAASVLKARAHGCGCVVEGGEEAVLKAASFDESEMILNAAMGIAGLKPTLAAIESHKTLALANKESLVCAGGIVMKRAAEMGVSVIPVDSEHSAIFQCLQGQDKDRIDKIILTASGGPFFGRSLSEMHDIKASDALKHPTWSMGRKITIDSATMMNKGFEVIEARWLFDVSPSRIEVAVHRESIVHSMVKYIDGSVIAQLGSTDMRLPIMYAIYYPERVRNPFNTLDIFSAPPLTFRRPDREAFPALALCEKAANDNGNMGAIINGANEVAVDSFLKGEIGFTDIYETVVRVLENVGYISNPCAEDIFEADRLSRQSARLIIESGR